MRTTLNIADDVLIAVKERARREKRTAGEVLSDLAREALTGGVRSRGRYEADEVAEPESFFGFEPLPPRGPAVSNDLIDRLREDEPE
jgi:hypothetical protein